MYAACTTAIHSLITRQRGLAFHIAGHELHHHRIVRERYLPLLGQGVAASE